MTHEDLYDELWLRFGSKKKRFHKKPPVALEHGSNMFMRPQPFISQKKKHHTQILHRQPKKKRDTALYTYSTIKKNQSVSSTFFSLRA